MFVSLQEVKKWKTGSFLTIQLPSKLQKGGKYYRIARSNKQNGLCDGVCQEEMPHQGDRYLGHISRLMNSTKSQNGLTCFLLYLHNLAEPTLVSSPCNKTWPYPLVCIKDKVDVKFTQVNRKSVVANYLCTLNAFLVDGFCYEFHWISEFGKKQHQFIFNNEQHFKIDIRKFTYIFEAIALEDRALTIFLPRDPETMYVAQFVRYLDTLRLKKNVVSHPNCEGYIIYPSAKVKIHLGSNTFKCLKGSNILHEYVCDGIIDCPNDRSDEDFCACIEKRQSKPCKTINVSRNVVMCSTTYYTAQNGECLKYTSFGGIYKQFNIKYVKTSTKIMRTSKLSVFNDSTAVNGQVEIKDALRSIEYITCLNPGEIPCLEGYSNCYNISLLCIYQLNPDKNLIPCENGRHLERCEQFSCDILFKCLNNYCISWSYVCDGKWDCPRGDDELAALMCKNNVVCINMYHCRGTDQMCLHLGNICDGHNDCLFGDDELLCELKTVNCPQACTCLLYAIDCRGYTDEHVEGVYLDLVLSVYF